MENACPLSNLPPDHALFALSAAELCEAAPDAMLVVDDSGRIALANRAMATLCRWPLGELLGRDVEVLLPSDARSRHVARRADFASAPRRRPMGSGLTLRALCRDGSELPVEVSLSPLFVADQVWTMVALRDVTDRERAAAELGRAQVDLARSEERERIGRDLHDTVIQHLFAVGMHLQAAESDLVHEANRAKIQWAVDHLDQTIREVRSVIFGLSSANAAEGIRAQMLEIVGVAGESLGFEPRVTFDGLIETTVSLELADHLFAVLREALSNVARHAGATRVDVSVIATDDVVTVTVTDNGCGLPAVLGHGNGLANLRARAEALRGSVRWEPVGGGGTRLVFSAPHSEP